MMMQIPRAITPLTTGYIYNEQMLQIPRATPLLNMTKCSRRKNIHTAGAEGKREWKRNPRSTKLTVFTLNIDVYNQRCTIVLVFFFLK